MSRRDEPTVLALAVGLFVGTMLGAALTAYSVDLIDKNDAGGVALCLIEKIAHSTGADADEHFDELGTRYGEEGHTRFP